MILIILGSQEIYSTVRNSINFKHIRDLLRPTSREPRQFFSHFLIFHNSFRSRVIRLSQTIKCGAPLRVLKDQSAVVHLFTLESLNPGDVDREFISLDGADALVL
jgi:hypothetical protein